MKPLFWKAITAFVSQPKVATWLIERAMRTPYEHITSADGQQIYMGRWWLFEGYDRARQRPRFRWFPWSIRIHHIRSEDHGRDLHDHPWEARSIILQGWYVEERLVNAGGRLTQPIWRGQGTTAVLRPGDYHRIDQVSPDGVFTLFITRPKSCDWGFLVSGEKVPWHQYPGARD
jgi:hypothetical protein